MDAYKECIEEYANQYLEAAVLGELEKAKLAYAEGHSLTENIGEMAQEEEPDWVDVEGRIQTAATKRNVLGYQSMAMRQIYFAMEPLEHDAVKEEIAKLQVERNSEPVRQQYAMLGALKALDANCRDMFKRQPHNMVAELANEWYDILLAKQETERLFKFRAYYNTKEKQMMPARYSADRLGRTRPVTTPAPIRWKVKATKIITSDQSTTVVNSSSPAQPSTGDWSVRVGSEASDMLPNVPPPGRARLSRTSRHVIISDNGTRSRSPAPSIPTQSKSPPPTPASPPRKIKKGGKTKAWQKKVEGSKSRSTEETNDPELQYSPVHSNMASRVTDRSEARVINTPQHTNTLTTQPSATARKRVTEEERLARDAEQYRAAEGSKRQSKKSSRSLNL
ncbi:hypothetical protein BDN71DRAFT_1434936 [Pleurotus eryngii]|uniref:Uncharacterized protein n=1 Tax=Pleurotus eryngii TaxID=5323 RepID=A0A9P5ZL56_PLEER|nr:hypothetical protein BDN71DRAFT_1434936 [Pleurotus eryngii]